MTAVARHAHSAPIGTGVLHNALEDARDLANLNGFCQGMHCTAAEVSSDGIRLDILRVIQMMRTRGYQVSDPVRPQAQPRKGFTVWLINVTLPAGVAFTLGFCTPNTS